MNGFRPKHPPTRQQQHHHHHSSSRFFSLRFVLLAILVVQNSLAALNGRYTRSKMTSTSSYDNDEQQQQHLYDIGHFVLVSEVGKLVASLVLECIATRGGLLESLRRHMMMRRPHESLKLVIPALLYFASNNLRYVAVSYLNVPVLEVASQARLVTTAALSVVFLKRRYSIKQWMCLMATSAGVGIVVLAEAISQTEFALLQQDRDDQDLWLGLLAVGAACLLASTSGVYFEKVIKMPQPAKSTNNTSTTATGGGASLLPVDKVEGAKQLGGQTSTTTTETRTTPSLWMLNVQLAFFSVIIATLQSLHNRNYNATTSTTVPSFFHGFTIHVWLQVGLFAGGGIIVAAVTKHADNVLKGLATCISMVLSSYLSRLLFRRNAPPLSLYFFMGAALIVAGVYFFSNPMPLVFVGKRITTTSRGTTTTTTSRDGRDEDEEVGPGVPQGTTPPDAAKWQRPLLLRNQASVMMMMDASTNNSV